MKDCPPQATLTGWALVPGLWTISALEPSVLRQATFCTFQVSVESMRCAPGRTNFVRCPVV